MRGRMEILKSCFLSRLMVIALVMGPTGMAQAETIIEYLTPTSASSPAGLNFDSKGNLWFTQFFANKISRLDFSEDFLPKVIDYRFWEKEPERAISLWITTSGGSGLWPTRKTASAGLM